MVVTVMDPARGRTRYTLNPAYVVGAFRDRDGNGYRWFVDTAGGGRMEVDHDSYVRVVRWIGQVR